MLPADDYCVKFQDHGMSVQKTESTSFIGSGILEDVQLLTNVMLYMLYICPITTGVLSIEVN